MFKFFHNLLRRLRIAIAKPQIEKNRLEKSATFAWDLSRHCVHQLRKDKATQMAAALTYHTLFSLLPTVVLMLVVGRAFVGDAEIEQFKEWVVDNALRGLIVQEAPPPSPSVEGVDEPRPGVASESQAATQTATQASTQAARQAERHAQTQAKPQAEARAEAQGPTRAAESASGGRPGGGDRDAGLSREQYDQARQQLRKDVQHWLDRLENINFGSIGVVGVLVFIFGATNLLSTIEGSFNSIYSASNKRPWRLRFPMYFTTLVLAPVVVIAGQVGQQGALDTIGSVGWLGPVASVVAVLSPLVTMWFVLWLMYVLLPNTHVSRRAAAMGSLFAAVLWVLLVFALQIYAKSATIAPLYGALALLPLALVWLWLTWVIVLFGLEVAYALQTLPERKLAEQNRGAQEDQLVDARALVPIMASIGDGFARGQPLSAHEIGAQLGLPDRLVHRVLDHLLEENLLHRVMGSDQALSRFTLARPPEQITVQRLLDTGTRLTVSKLTAGRVPGASTLQRLNEAVAHAAGDTTLAHVIHADDASAPADTDRTENTGQEEDTPSRT